MRYVKDEELKSRCRFSRDIACLMKEEDKSEVKCLLCIISSMIMDIQNFIDAISNQKVNITIGEMIGALDRFYLLSKSIGLGKAVLRELVPKYFKESHEEVSKLLGEKGNLMVR